MLPRFAPDPDGPPLRAGDPARWRRVLLAAAAVAAAATMLPWSRVRDVLARLFGAHDGPPGWQSSAGFTCLCTCALVVILALAETPARATLRAARPASLMLVAVTAVALLLEGWSGPGELRGLAAERTPGFWLAALGVPVLLLACLLRWLATDAAAVPGYSSSGPPT